MPIPLNVQIKDMTLNSNGTAAIIADELEESL